MNPQRILEETFGYAEFRGAQREVIDAMVHGQDALVVMPTGGGKSLCYQIPGLALAGTAIVVSPLIALMADQVAALRQLGVRAAFLNSTLDVFEQRAIANDLRSGYLDLLYVAPERLLMAETLELIDGVEIALVAVDEAHCVSAWGHDFRRDYLELARVREHTGAAPWIALTATADERTREDIVANLRLRDARRFVAGFDRHNIHYQVALKAQPMQQLFNFLESRRGEAGIVYCLSRRSVEDTAQKLADAGYDALPYHAGLDAGTRARNQERFLRADGVIVVATVAFGMGIDKPDVRFVVHLDLPKSIEAYYQETGRAGRDGAAAQAYMVYGLQDVVRLSQMVSESDADEDHKRVEQQKLTALLGWCEITSCRRAGLLSYFGDALEGACSGCDVCDAPPVTFDGTEAAQKFLSCVVRTGQRFGAGHIIDVLRGADRPKIHQLGHDALPTYGIGSDISDLRWRSIARQLVAQGYLIADPNRYGALRLTQMCRPLLRGDSALLLREDPAGAAAKRSAKRRTREPAVELDAESAAIFERLRELRKAIADEQNVPPYVIFHDATLREMALLRPQSHAEFLGLGGVGQSKLERFGDRFLEALGES
ncbi:MAG: DNA helicase RecQ [Pseudomonadota bacterium]